jgi:hypothetical protein
VAVAALMLGAATVSLSPTFAQKKAATAAASEAEPKPLREAELQVLVARIPLYPDETRRKPRSGARRTEELTQIYVGRGLDRDLAVNQLGLHAETHRATAAAEHPRNP